MKKSIKILIIVLCIVIIGLVTYIIVDKCLENSKKSENNAVINSNAAENIVNETAENSGKNDVNATNENKTNNDTSKQNAESNDSLIKDEALDVVKNEYDSLLSEYDESEVNSFGEEDITKEINGVLYQAEVNSDFINNIKNKCTENGFKDVLEQMCIDEQNGKYYLQADIGDNDPRYLSHSYSITEVSNTKITGKLIVKRDDSENPTQYYDVVLVNENGKWLIDNYDYIV